MRIAFLFLVLNCQVLFGQSITGVVLNSKTKLPVEFVNIGVPGKGIGTVSDEHGRFTLSLDPQFSDNSLLFSCIGYMPFSIKIPDLISADKQEIFLQEKVYQLDGVTVSPKYFKQRTLGVTAHAKNFSAGFKNNLLGYECGILMKVKKTAVIKRVNINFSGCTYDSIFYRLNIYKVAGKMNFENILKTPIYLNLSGKNAVEGIHIDLQPYKIVVDGDFLITLEHVKDLGPGYLYFCVGLADKTYYRRTSQGSWETVPIGVSISVDADVER